MQLPFLKPVFATLAMLGLTTCAQEGAQAQLASESVSTITANWTVNPEQSRISFSGNQGGEAFTGHFNAFTAEINFEPDNLDASEVAIAIDIAGVDAGDPDRTGALPGEDWFALEDFPQARFSATVFRSLGDNQYEADGELTIRDVTRPVTLAFSLTIADGVATMSGTTSINRLDFNIGTGTWATEEWAGHNVDISVVVKASRN